MPSPEDFIQHVKRCKTLDGLEVHTEWLAEGTVAILARYPYGPWNGFTIFACTGTSCESESGAPMMAPDVAVRLKRTLTLPSVKRYGVSADVVESHRAESSKLHPLGRG